MSGENEKRFIDLAESNGGFEIVLGFRDWEDHYIGGKNGKYWYLITKDEKPVKCWIGEYAGGVWKDTLYKGKGKPGSAAKPGTALKLIAEKAYLCQDEKWVAGKTGRVLEDRHPHRHFVYGFGDKALDVSAVYGVTIGYSDINDVSAGFRFRDILVGGDVEIPSV